MTGARMKCSRRVLYEDCIGANRITSTFFHISKANSECDEKQPTLVRARLSGVAEGLSSLLHSGLSGVDRILDGFRAAAGQVLFGYGHDVDEHVVLLSRPHLGGVRSDSLRFLPLSRCRGPA